MKRKQTKSILTRLQNHNLKKQFDDISINTLMKCIEEAWRDCESRTKNDRL